MPIQKTVLGLFLLLSVGCTTVTANPDDWTVERAKKLIQRAEVRKLQWARLDKSEITEKDLGCADDHFIHFYHEDTQVEGEEQTVRFTIKKIRFADIAQVRVESSWNILWSWPMTGGITGPWVFDIHLVMKDGATIPLDIPYFHRIWHFANYFPMWLYPYNILHGKYPLAEAFDFMRQKSSG